MQTITDELAAALREIKLACLTRKNISCSVYRIAEESLARYEAMKQQEGSHEFSKG